MQSNATFSDIMKFIDQINKLIYHREKFCQLQASFRFLETRALVMLGWFLLSH